MKKLAIILMILLGLAFSAPRVLTQDKPADSAINQSILADLPDYNSDPYKVDPYLRAAVALQALGKKQASERLSTLAKESEERASAVFVLCRMLFTKRKDSTFRRPGLGGPMFFGGTRSPDWPLEPIELVDGIPFCIVSGYYIRGKAEPAAKYLNYCLQNCDWNPFPFKLKSEQEKQAALQKLIASPKWKTPLAPYERTFLSSQIK